MKSWSSPAAAATLVLHALLAAALVAGLSNDKKQDTPPAPLKIQLLPPVPAPVAPATPVMPAPPVAAQAPKKKLPEPKPRAETKPAPPTPAAAGPQAPASTAAPDARNAPAAASDAPVAAPAAPSAPARTSASDASYAGTNSKPPYPRRSRANDEQGTVVLRVLVKADGTAGAVEVKNSSGYPLLDESARSTVQTWRFKPATVDGKPVAEWYQVAVPFKLQDN